MTKLFYQKLFKYCFPPANRCLVAVLELRILGNPSNPNGGQKSGRLRRVWPAALVGSAHGPLARFGPGLLHAPCTHALL